METDGGTLVGRLRLDSARAGLGEVIENGRTYLSLWDATVEGSGVTDEFVAIHKGAIRSVMLLAEDAAGPATSTKV